MSEPQRFTILNTAEQPSHFSLLEKKSEFVGNAAHCTGEAEALAFVEAIREANPKARHVAYAAIFESEHDGVGERMSDDGEPSGTAGKPILDALSKSHTSACVVSVTRYFGGVLLGSAGLIRAYSTAASGALQGAKRARVVEHVQCSITVDYAQLGTLDHFLEQAGGKVEHRDFTDVVLSTLVVPKASYARFAANLQQAFQDSVRPDGLKRRWVSIPLK